MESMVVKRSPPSLEHGRRVKIIMREAIMVLIMAVCVGYLMMWVMTGTHIYKTWFGKILVDTNSTYFGFQGPTILVYTFPVLFIVVMSCIYLHWGKQVSDNSTERIGSSSESKAYRRLGLEVLAELDREHQVRKSAENTKSELQVLFNRLKALAHEAIKKRDESGRQRDEAVRDKDEALRLNEKLSAELTEACRVKDETLMQRDELAKQFEEAVKAKELSRSEIETAAQMLVTGIEKISGKVSNFKNFTAGGLPRSNKYTGLPAVAYGVIKRTNEIVEELLRQIDSRVNSS